MAIKYKYTAVSRNGLRSHGIIESDTESGAVSAIKSSGLIPVKLSRFSQGGSKFALALKSSIKSEELLVFTRKLLTLNKAGVSILQGLNIIISDIGDPKLAEILSDIRKSIEGGSNLSEAFEKHEGFFPELYISTLKAGEESGSMDIMLERAAELIEREIEVKESIRSSIRYPFYVMVTIGLAFIVVITFVIPKFSGFYSSYGAELPWATQLMIAINRFFMDRWLVLAMSAPVLLILFWRLKLTAAGRQIYDYISIKFPIIGKLIIKTILSRFCFILSTLLASGLPLTQALDLVKSSIGNYYFSKVISEMGEKLSGGADVVSSMRSFKYFSPMIIQMFSIGLESGSLESVLLEVARHYDVEIKRDSKRLASRIEPALTLIIGIAVLILALAIFLPMWNMITVFRK